MFVITGRSDAKGCKISQPDFGAQNISFRIPTPVFGAGLIEAITESTIVVFLTDNGPAFPRYNAGLRGLKGTVYEGGIHVPCYLRWPRRGIYHPGTMPPRARHRYVPRR